MAWPGKLFVQSSRPHNNINRPSQIHVKLSSPLPTTAIVVNKSFWNFVQSMTVILCGKFHEDLLIKNEAINNKYFVRLQSMMDFGEIVYIVKGPWFHQGQGPISLKFMSLSSKFRKNRCNFTLKTNDPINSQFCTCHDSSAVVTCAKLLHQWIIKIKTRTIRIFVKILIMSS